MCVMAAAWQILGNPPGRIRARNWEEGMIRFMRGQHSSVRNWGPRPRRLERGCACGDMSCGDRYVYTIAGGTPFPSGKMSTA